MTCLHFREIQHDLIDVTPSPRFTGLKRAHDGIFRRVKMHGGVFIFRRIAATDVTARHAQTKVHLGIPDLQALLTTTAVWPDVANRTQMRASFHSPFSSGVLPARLQRGDSAPRRSERKFLLNCQ